MTRILSGCLLGLLGAGCVSVGTPQAVNDRAASHLTATRHEMQDVRRLLGAPTDSGHAAAPPRTGRRPIQVWTYDYTHVVVTPATCIPLLGPFLGDSPVTSGALTLRFDAAGTLRAVQQSPRFQEAPPTSRAWPDWLEF